MALIVETGAGLANAESLCSVAFANTHHTARGRETTWTDLDDEVKEAALRSATDYLAVYAARWAGMRSTAVQALDWPRAYVPRACSLTGGTYYYASDAIPEPLQRAVAELAFKSLSGPLLPDVAGALPVQSVKVGPISKSYDTSRAQPAPRYPQVDSMLLPFFTGGAGSAGMIKMVRA